MAGDRAHGNSHFDQQFDHPSGNGGARFGPHYGEHPAGIPEIRISTTLRLAVRACRRRLCSCSRPTRGHALITVDSMMLSELWAGAGWRDGLSWVGARPRLPPKPQIAEQLALPPRTVDNHLANVYQKLGVTSRAELAGLFK